MKIVEFDSNGTIQNSRVICSPALLNIVATDIIQAVNNSGYYICGYMKSETNYPIFPFVLKLNNSLSVVGFEKIVTNGAILRIKQFGNGDLVAVGYNGNGADNSSVKGCMIIKLDAMMNVLSNNTFTSSNFNLNYSCFHDVEIINGEVIIAGNIMNLNNACEEIRLVFLKFNLSTNTISWQNTQINGDFVGSKLAIQGDNTIVVSNGKYGASSIIAKYSINTGNLLTTLLLRGVPDKDICLGTNHTYRPPVFQNFYFIGTDSIFVSGKFIENDERELPFDFCIENLNQASTFWTSYNRHLYTTRYYSNISDFFGYKYNKTNLCGFPLVDIAPMYSSKNTVMINKKHVTITYTHVGINSLAPSDLFKTWIFTNGYSGVYGYSPLYLHFDGNYNNISNNITLSFSQVNTTNSLQFSVEHDISPVRINCGRRGECCN